MKGKTGYGPGNIIGVTVVIGITEGSANLIFLISKIGE